MKGSERGRKGVKGREWRKGDQGKERRRGGGRREGEDEEVTVVERGADLTLLVHLDRRL